MNTEPQVALARPYWNEEGFFHGFWAKESVTILICQRKTRDLIRLCLSSVLNHYPEVPVLVVDGDSNDASTEYLRFIAAKHSNVTVWERTGRNSHGDTMHEAIRDHVKTKFVVLMDSDTIMRRGAILEMMCQQFDDNSNLYATGSLMLVSRENQACGDPKDEKDILRYAHPSFSMYHVPTYLQMNAPFSDHGAPCVFNMIKAAEMKLDIGYLPVEKFVQHLCGASWQEVPTVWDDDGDVQLRPFVTFIITHRDQSEMLRNQSDHDFNMVTLGRLVQKKVGTYVRPFDISNYYYDIRFQVTGEYVCLLPENVTTVDPYTVELMRQEAIRSLQADEKQFTFGGLLLIDRREWQKTVSMS